MSTDDFPIPDDDELERQIESFGTMLQLLAERPEVAGTTAGFDVVELCHWPRRGETTFVTCGLSGFLLPARDGPTAHELVMTFHGTPSSGAAIELLEHVADAVLERRIPISDNERFSIPERITAPLAMFPSEVACHTATESTRRMGGFFQAVRVVVVELVAPS